MTTVTALWYDFKRRRRDPASPVNYNRDNIPDACAADGSAEVALRRAVRSIRPNGKMHNHQSKVSRALPAYEENLVKHIRALTHAETFGALYYLFEMFA